MTREDKSERKGMAGKIQTGKHMLKMQFASFMNRIFFKKSWPFLIIFCITSGGCSVYLLLNTFLSEPDASLQIGVLKTAFHLHRSTNTNEPSGQYVDRETYKQITQFKIYLDSLKSLGNPLYDTIIQTRPHLLDSLGILEEMYHSQNK